MSFEDSLQHIYFLYDEGLKSLAFKILKYTSKEILKSRPAGFLDEIQVALFTQLYRVGIGNVQFILSNKKLIMVAANIVKSYSLFRFPLTTP